MNSPLSQPRKGVVRPLHVIASVFLFLILISTAFVPSVSAQSFNSDARMVAMGGSDQSNDATSLTQEARSYKSIGLPLGLIQLYKHRKAFDPGDKVNFNPLRVIEDVANPIHITFGRQSETQGELIVKDLVQGNLHRNLLDYKGFVPKSPLSAQGMFSPNFGKTIKVMKVGDLYQGIYVGAGPYLTAGTGIAYDQRLLDAWDGTTSTVPANTSLFIHNDTSGQVALDITGGYRARFETPKAIKLHNGSDRDGVYVAVNYHYLRGYHYDSDAIDVTIDTDSTGQIALAIPASSPVLVDRTRSSKGKGRAVDVATNVVTGPWEFNFGADGIGNQIEWESLVHEQFTLSYLLSGLDFVKTTLAPPTGTVIVKLPVQFSSGATYNAKKWTLQGQFSRRLNGREYHAGGEYHLGPIDLRAGGRYTKSHFNPMGGAGLNITSHFGIDAAIFSTSANAQQDRRVAMAYSLRFQ